MIRKKLGEVRAAVEQREREWALKSENDYGSEPAQISVVECVTALSLCSVLFLCSFQHFRLNPDLFFLPSIRLEPSAEQRKKKRNWKSGSRWFEGRHGSIKIYRKDIKHWFMCCGWLRSCRLVFCSCCDFSKLFFVSVFWDSLPLFQYSDGCEAWAVSIRIIHSSLRADTKSSAMTNAQWATRSS